MAFSAAYEMLYFFFATMTLVNCPFALMLIYSREDVARGSSPCAFAPAIAGAMRLYAFRRWPFPLLARRMP